jgi:tRNA A-37 threonylcarbamoyl transferase component Bud32
MEIIVKGNGLHKSETNAVSQMEALLRPSWYGYASVLVADKRGSMEFDMIIITHDRVLVVELKEWRGVLTSFDGQWKIDGEYRCKSPYHTKRDQALRLSGILREEIGHKLGYNPYVEAHVVMCGEATPEHLPASERRYVHTLDEFLKIRESADYESITQDVKLHFDEVRRPRPNSANAKKIFDVFFRGHRVTLADFQYMNYTSATAPDRVHPNQLFQEFPASYNPQPTIKGLMRRWDLTMLGLAYHDDESWRKVVTREDFLYRTASASSSPLEQFLLKPIAPLVEDNINSDCVELFELKKNTRRLEDHLNLYSHKWSVEDRLDLVQALLAPFAELHAMGAAHRDIDTQNLWYSQDHRIVIASGFHSAFIPEKGSVKDLSEKLRSGLMSLPEDIYGEDGEIQSPFAKDVFLLALVAHKICFPGAKIYLEDNIPVWQPVADDPLQGKMDAFFERAMELEQKNRFANASEMLAEFNTITIGKPLQYDDTQEVMHDIAKGDFIKKEWSHLGMMVYFPPAPGVVPTMFGDKITYECVFEGERCLIKFWQKASVDVKTPGLNRRIQKMRKRIEQALDADLPLPKLMTYGLFGGGIGLFVVTRYEDGECWPTFITSLNTLEEKLEAGLSLCNLILHIHGRNFAHGDLHPGNVLAKAVADDAGETGRALMLIDALDFGDTSNPYNVEYGPANPLTADHFGRDLYATYQMVSELLGAEAPQGVRQEIERAKEQPNSIPVAIDPLRDCLSQALGALRAPEPIKEAPLQFISNDFKLPEKELLLQPEGIAYHFQVERSQRDKELLHCRITAQEKRLNINFDPQKRTVQSMWISDISLSDYISSSQKSQHTFTTPVTVTRGIAPQKSPDPIAEFVLGIDAVLTLLESAAHEEAEVEELLPVAGESINQTIKPSAIWKTLLTTEGDQRRRVEVLNGPLEESATGSLLIPCQPDSEQTLEFTDEEDQEIGLYFSGENRPFGHVVTEECSMNTLAVRVFREGGRSLKQKLVEGTELIFESKQNNASRSRRQKAMDKVLNGLSRIQSLPAYFDEHSGISSKPIGQVPDEAKIRARYDTENEQLNDGQIAAFQRVIAEGPLSVLQGPPGTGKTAFVSKFIHYLFENELAGNILLVGQSHTSVDTVAIKTREVCSAYGTDITVVRLGQEGMIDDKLLQCHSSSIQRQIRHKFQREYEKRINALASRLMLNQELVEELAKLHRSIGPLLDRVRTFTAQLQEISGKRHIDASEREPQITEIVTKIDDCIDLLERNLNTRGYSFDLPSPAEPTFWSVLSNQVARQHGVTNQLALQRLNNLISISKDWIDVLASGGANYDKFLVKTSQLVCGTLVGIGGGGLHIDELEFDWVIVDEAGRAQASELMIALQCAKRGVLVGDHKQLKPMYDRQHTRAVAKLLDIDEREVTKTDFERAFIVNNGIALDTQYRMIEPIGDIVSKCFYDKVLKSHRKTAPDWYADLPYPLNVPVAWIDSGVGERSVMEDEPQKGKFINRHEAAVCLHLIKQLTKPEHLSKLRELKTEHQPFPIGIITMYKAQKRLLEEDLSRAEWAAPIRDLIKIETADGYQGEQNRVIILSLVRNNPAARQGFLVDPSRINVALSRAQERLVVIGAQRMWQAQDNTSALREVMEFIVDKHSSAPGHYEVVDGTTVIEGIKHA